MMARSTMIAWLSLSMTAACRFSPDSPTGTSTVSLEGAGSVVDIPAVDHQRYPDNLGYVYQGALANILWLQSDSRAEMFTELVQSMQRGLARGVDGELLSSQMQHVDAIPDTQPSLSQMSKGAVQSARQLAQYAAVTADYGSALGTALVAYNSDAARNQAITDMATRINGELAAAAAPNSSQTPRAAPPLSQRVLKPGAYLSDSVRDHTRAHLTRSAAQLEAAITTNATAAYADAFMDVFIMQRDLDLTLGAAEALAVHHVNGLLRGRPLDGVIAIHMTPLPAPDRPLSVEQLSLVNQINLSSSDPAKPRAALVAALLLVDEDHRQGELDGTLSCLLIWQHVTDATWLVDQLVRLKSDGTTVAQVNAAIAAIVASI